MNIKEFKQQNPDYADVPDEQLAQALHKKNYSDISYEDFASKFLVAEDTTKFKSSGGASGSWAEEIPLWKKRLSFVIRESLPVITGGLGAALTPSPEPFARLAGGTLAYAGGAEIADILDESLGIKPKEDTVEKESNRLGQHLYSGAMNQLTDQIIGNVFDRWKMKKDLTKTTEFLKEKGINQLPSEITGKQGSEAVVAKMPFARKTMEEFSEGNIDKFKNRVINPALDTFGEKSNLPEQIDIVQNRLSEVGQKEKSTVASIVTHQAEMAKRNLEINTKQATDLFQEFTDKVSGKFGIKGTLEAGNLFQANVEKNSQEIYATANQLFDEVRKVAPTDEIPMDKTVNFVVDLLEKQKKRIKGLRLSSDLITTLEDVVKKGEKDLDIKFDYSAFMENFSGAGEKAAKEDLSWAAGNKMKFQSSPEGGVYKKIRQLMMEDLDEFVKENGNEDFKESWGIAREYYKNAKDMFDSSIMKMIKANPQAVAKDKGLIFRPYNAETIEKVFKAVDSETRLDLTGAWIRDLSEGNMETFAKNIAGYEDETLKAIFKNPSDLKQITNARDYFSSLNLKSKTGEIIKFSDEQISKSLKTISRLIEKQPESFMDTIFSKEGARDYQFVRRVVGKEQTDNLKRIWLEKAVSPKGEFSPTALNNLFTSYDENILKQILSEPGEFKFWKQIANAGKGLELQETISKQRNVSYGDWSIGMQTLKGYWNTALGMTGVPYGMSKLYTSKVGRNLLAEGFTISVESPLANKWIEQISKIVGRKETEKFTNQVFKLQQSEIENSQVE